MAHEIYLVDDDGFFGESFRGICGDLGYSCATFGSFADMEAVLSQQPPQFCVVDLAIPLGTAASVSSLETKGGYSAGLALIRKARETWKTTRFAIITGGPSSEVKRWCDQNEVEYMLKPIDRGQVELFFGKRSGRAFVVHGRDRKALGKAKAALQKIGIAPVVLMEQPEQGRTVIEKFEEVGAECDYAVVLLSPDDVGGLAGGHMRLRRARQNVIFELGYFCGSYGRRSGRVVIIEFGETDIPSDIVGVVRVDGTVSMAKLVTKLQGEIA